MKKVHVTTTIFAMALISLTALSCKDDKKENVNGDSNSEMTHDENKDNTMEHDNMDMASHNGQMTSSIEVIADYMTLKEALVSTDKEAAANAGNRMVASLQSFVISGYNVSQQKELQDIIANATEHAEHIGKSEMDQQREHFKTLSKDMMDMVAITGTDATLYQQTCPMYDKGSAWLSMEKDIKNPYYGSKMMTCGKVEKEIKSTM